MLSAWILAAEKDILCEGNSTAHEESKSKGEGQGKIQGDEQRKRLYSVGCVPGM